MYAKYDWRPFSKSEKRAFLGGAIFGTLVTFLATASLFTDSPWAALVMVTVGLGGLMSIWTRPEKPG